MSIKHNEADVSFGGIGNITMNKKVGKALDVDISDNDIRKVCIYSDYVNVWVTDHLGSVSVNRMEDIGYKVGSMMVIPDRNETLVTFDKVK